MKKLITTALVGVLGLSSVALADRGDRYSRSRSDASVRYERGNSRGDYSNGRNYGRDTGRDYGRDSSRDSGSRSRTSFSFGIGVSSGGYGDRSSFSLGVSRGYSRGSDSYGGYGYRSYGGPQYYEAPRYYVEPAPVYVAPAPIYVAPPVYYAPSYYAPAYYSAPAYGGYYSSRSSYSYCR